MNKPFKMTGSPFLRNFGIGPGLSPYKQDEGEGEEKKGKGWKKAAGLAAGMVSAGLDSVYGGVGGEEEEKEKTKDTEEIIAPTPGQDLLNKMDNLSETQLSATNLNDFYAAGGGKLPSKEVRAEMYKKMGGTDVFTGTAEQNTQLLKHLQSSGSPSKMLSPLKARQAHRGGKHAGKATKTARRRGGFPESKGKRGAGGRNVGGYNVQTRFSPRKTEPTGGIEKLSTSSGSSKPYSYNKQGGITINNYGGGTQEQTQTQTQGQEWVPAVYGTRTTGLPTYRQAWAEESRWTIKDGKRIDKYGHVYSDDISGFEAYEAASEKYKKEHGGGGGTKTERYLISEGYYRPTGGTQIQSQTQRSGAKFKGKFAFGGYRTMHGK